MATTYRLKRKTFAFGLASLGKAFNGIMNGGNAARLQKVVDAGHGAAKIGGSTAAQTLNNTQNIGKNLTKGALGLGTTAAVGYGGIKLAKGTKDTFTGQMGESNGEGY
jgi:hypothetical protein